LLLVKGINLLYELKKYQNKNVYLFLAEKRRLRRKVETYVYFENKALEENWEVWDENTLG
jgi:uridine kinase